MVCNKCNHKLPEDSEFCQYCGNKIENEVVNQMEIKEEAIVIESPTVEIDKKKHRSIEKTKEKKLKVRFCKFCGGQIDAQTKKCSGCGKQYFKGIKFNKFLTMVLILFAVILSSVTLNIAQFIKINEINEEIEQYEEKIVNFKKQLKEKDDSLKRYKNYYKQDTSYTGIKKIKKLYGLD